LLLYQDENGFLFNSDAHFLYHFISEFNPKGDLLDIGCGCGVVGLLLKRDFNIDLTGIDIQKQNIKLSTTNARVNNLKANFICGDFLKMDLKKRFDIIISNPPYYHEGVSKSSNKKIAISKYNQNLPLSNLIKRANSIIKPKGSLIFCYDPKQIQDIIFFLKESKFILTDLRFVHGSKDKESKLVLIRAKKGSNSLCNIYKPLIHFENGKLSKEANKIYQKTRTYSIKCQTL